MQIKEMSCYVHTLISDHHLKNIKNIPFKRIFYTRNYSRKIQFNSVVFCSIVW